jgi:hypothetical protein
MRTLVETMMSSNAAVLVGSVSCSRLESGAGVVDVMDR